MERERAEGRGGMREKGGRSRETESMFHGISHSRSVCL